MPMPAATPSISQLPMTGYAPSKFGNACCRLKDETFFAVGAFGLLYRAAPSDCEVRAFAR